MKRKISPSCLQGKGWVTNPEYFIGGSILLSKGGSVQVSVKDRGAQRQRDQKKRTRLDIQARIREQLPDITKQLRQIPVLDIQAQKATQPLEMTLLLGSFSCLDIQIQIAKSIPLEHNFIIQTGGDGYAKQTGS